MYDSWKSCMELYIENRENRRMILNSKLNGPLVWPIIDEDNGTTRTKKYEELSVAEKLQADCDLKATNIVLQGLPLDVTKKYEELSVAEKLQADCDLRATNIVLQGLPLDVYAIVNHHKVAKEICDRVKLLMQGKNCHYKKRNGYCVTSLREARTKLSGTGYKCNATSYEENNAGGQTEDLDAYDFDCDDVSYTKAVLMANLSNYGSYIISGVRVPHYEPYHTNIDNQRLKSYTSASRSQPTSNKKNDRISQTPSNNMKNKVEDHHRRVKSKSNKKNRVKDPICDANVKHTMLNLNYELIYVKCNQCMFDANHDVCFFDFVNDVNVRSKSMYAKKSQQHNIWKSTGNRSHLMNFVSKFLGTVQFENDQIAKIMSEDLGKLNVKADIGIFVGYAPEKKAFRIYNRRTKKIMETIHVTFDELTTMASEQFSSKLRLQSMTPATFSSGLVPNLVPQQPFNPPTRNDWYHLFQLMFNEYSNLLSSDVSLVPVAVAPRAIEIAATPSSTTIDQDAPSSSTSSTNQQQQSSIISQ
nr:hypothetical protein [Tanacetum cinerariifolium]